VQPEGLGKLIKFNYLFGIQTHYLPAYSIVPEPLATECPKLLELHDFYTLPNITRMAKSRRMRWA
jgi:hypothetical protein